LTLSSKSSRSASSVASVAFNYVETENGSRYPRTVIRPIRHDVPRFLPILIPRYPLALYFLFVHMMTEVAQQLAGMLGFHVVPRGMGR
jgi:hypothetical protein